MANQSITCDGIKISNKQLDFPCPVCVDQRLHLGELQGTQVSPCGGCSGFLIDSPSLAVLIQHFRKSYRGDDDKPQPIDRQELEQTIDCPACASKMYTHPYHGPGNVIVNSCSHCKLNWLDQGELIKIIRAPGRR